MAIVRFLRRNPLVVVGGLIVLAWIVVGPWAGLLAGLIVGTYPPLIGATGDQLSEPLGAFLLLAAFVALALALERRRLWCYAAAGALLGLTILTRTDLLEFLAHRRGNSR